MVEALLLGALVETMGLGPRPLACSFPGERPDETAIEVEVTPRPSLKDIPGLYRVEMAVNGALRLPAAAQPITATKGQDVMIRAAQDRTTFYTVGIDAEGRAALNVMVTEDPDTEPREATRAGHCRNYRTLIERWSANF